MKRLPCPLEKVNKVKAVAPSSTVTDTANHRGNEGQAVATTTERQVNNMLQVAQVDNQRSEHGSRDSGMPPCGCGWIQR